MISKRKVTELGVLSPEAIDLYFDYHSDDGALAQLVRKHSDMNTTELVCLLLEHSRAYGLSDLQAEGLIKKYGVEQIAGQMGYANP